MAAGPFAEGPEVGEDVSRDAAALVRHADDDVLGRFADGDLDRGRSGRGARPSLLLLDDGLDRVAQKLANDVL